MLCWERSCARFGCLPNAEALSWTSQRFPPPPGMQPGQNAPADMLRRLTAGGAAGLTACTLVCSLSIPSHSAAGAPTSHRQPWGVFKNTQVPRFHAVFCLCTQALILSHSSDSAESVSMMTHSICMVCSSRVAGALQAYPLDLVRTRLSAQTKGQYYTGIAHALRTIARDEGLLGLYRGLGATLLQVPHNHLSQITLSP